MEIRRRLITDRVLLGSARVGRASRPQLVFTSRQDDAIVKIVDFGLSIFAPRGREFLKEHVGTVKVSALGMPRGMSKEGETFTLPSVVRSRDACDPRC